MLDALLLNAIRRGSEKALGQIIDKYAAYVCAVICNAANLAREDVEETASDVFFALWEHAAKVRKPKEWLAATARNKAKNKLRGTTDCLPLEEEALAVSNDNSLEETVIQHYENEMVKQAVLAMDNPERDIFLRHYYQSQTVSAIGAETGLTEAAVKHRLVRGRKKLKKMLENQEVFS